MNTANANPLQRKLLVALAFVAGAFAVHALALGNPFVIDDHSAIRQHPDVQDTAGVLRLWGHHYWEGSPALDDQLYRPVTIFSFWLSQRLTPDSATGFRVVNILLLAGIALFVVSWLRRVTGPLPAVLAGVLFLVHPANTEAINHIVGRADLLAVFGIVGFLAVQQSAQQHGWTWPRTAGAAALALIALGSKESGLALVPCALAQWWVGTAALAPSPSQGEGWGEGRQSDPNNNDMQTATPDPPPNPLPPSREGEPETAASPVRQTCHSALGICPKRALFLALFLPVAAYLAARLLVVGLPADYAPATDDLTGNPLRGMGFFERLADTMTVAGWYITQLFFPSTTYNHTVLHDASTNWETAPFGTALTHFRMLIGAVAYVVLLVWSTRLGHKRSKVAVPATLFLAHLLIVGHLLTVTGAYAANRLTIATTASGVMLLGLLLAVFIKDSPRYRNAAVSGALLAALAFTFLTARANRAWSSELARMHADVQADDEDPIALYWLGQAQLAYDPDAAVSHLKRAHALAPTSNQAATALADALLATGDDRAAWKLYDNLLSRNAPLTDFQLTNAAKAAFHTERYERSWGLYNRLLIADAQLADEERAQAAMAAFNTGREDRARELIQGLPEAMAGPIRQALEESP